MPSAPRESTVLPFDTKQFLSPREPGMTPKNGAVALEIGKRLRRQRRHLGVTLSEIGRRAGVTHQQVQRFECGETQISAAMVWRLAEALGVSVHYLFGETATPRPDAEPSERRHRPAPPTAAG